MSTTGRSFRMPGDTDDVVGTARGRSTVPGRSLLNRLVATDQLTAGAIARLTLGLVMFPHALGIAAVMVGAIALVHANVGFFMNWYGTQAGEGFEYHLLAIGLALVCFLISGGTASVDRALTVRRSRGAGLMEPVTRD